MSQPPNNPGQDPQWDPQNVDGNVPQQPGPEGPHNQVPPNSGPVGPEGQPWNGPVGPDGQPQTGPIGPDGQPQTGPIGPDGQPWNGPIGPDGQPWNGPTGPDGQPWNGPIGPDGQHQTGPIGPDGQPWNGPIGPDGQPQTGPVGPDGKPWTGPVGPDGQPWNGGSSTQGSGKGFGVKQILSALLILVVVAVVGFFVYQNFQKEAALAVGNCLVISGESDDADHELAECGDASVYTQYVGEVIEGSGTCQDPDAAPYSITETSRGGNETTTKVTCLIPQLIEGQCYGFLPENNVNLLEPLACTDANTAIEVTSVVEESAAECPAGTEPVSYAVPARTYCLTYRE